MRDEDDDAESCEEDEEEAVTTHHLMPPSPEVPPSGRWVYLLVAVLVLAAFGYEFLPEAEAWWTAKTAWFSERDAAPPRLECRSVDIGVRLDDGGVIEIRQACLPSETWARSARPGGSDEDAAARAAFDYLRGDVALDGETQ